LKDAKLIRLIKGSTLSRAILSNGYRRLFCLVASELQKSLSKIIYNVEKYPQFTALEVVDHHRLRFKEAKTIPIKASGR